MSDSSSGGGDDQYRTAELEAMEAMTMVVQSNLSMVAGELVAPPPSPIRVDHRTLSRNEKRNFVHTDAVRCINRDYLGPHPVFDGREFDTIFRISKSSFQRIMEDFGNSGNPFYRDNPLDAFYKGGISMEARLLLPLKTMAYGVPLHTFTDYFQMSKTQAHHVSINSRRLSPKFILQSTYDNQLH